MVGSLPIDDRSHEDWLASRFLHAEGYVILILTKACSFTSVEPSFCPKQHFQGQDMAGACQPDGQHRRDHQPEVRAFGRLSCCWWFGSQSPRLWYCRIMTSGGVESQGWSPEGASSSSTKRKARIREGRMEEWLLRSVQRSPVIDPAVNTVIFFFMCFMKRGPLSSCFVWHCDVWKHGGPPVRRRHIAFVTTLACCYVCIMCAVLICTRADGRIILRM